MPIILTCQQCSTPYTEHKKSRFEKSKYCSRACWYAAKARLVKVDGETRKRCSKCGEIKPFSDYHCSTRSQNKTRAECKECQAAYMREYVKNNLPHRIALSKAWRVKNPERARRRDRGYTLKLKTEVIDALGGKCACCGESHIAFLSVDHINNDGAEHKRKLFNGKTIGGSSTVYRDIRKQGYPRDKFQVLCFNCNCAKAYSGTCPHKEEAAPCQ
jgi:hypothetical protein